jgi:hypothetical protein
MVGSEAVPRLLPAPAAPPLTGLFWPCFGTVLVLWLPDARVTMVFSSETWNFPPGNLEFSTWKPGIFLETWNFPIALVVVVVRRDVAVTGRRDRTATDPPHAPRFDRRLSASGLT